MSGVGKEREADWCWGEGGIRQTRGSSGLYVVCEDLCPSVRGSVCMTSSVYLLPSWISHFSPLTHSHLSPRVNIYRRRNAQSFGEHWDVQAAHCIHCLCTAYRLRGKGALSSSKFVSCEQHQFRKHSHHLALRFHIKISVWNRRRVGKAQIIGQLVIYWK